MTIQIQANALPTPQAVAANTLVTLSEATGGWVTYAWTLLDQPEGTADTITGPTTPTPTITVKKEGTYLFLLVVNGGTNTEQRATGIVYVKRVLDGERNPAAGETTEANLVRGWAENVNRQLTDISDLRRDAGRLCGVISFNGATADLTMLYAASTEVVLAALPGELSLPRLDLAPASTATAIQGALYLLSHGVVSGASPASGEVVWARAYGMVYAVPLAGAVVNNPVYVSDAGALALTPGTIPRTIGRIVAARANDCDVWFCGLEELRGSGEILRFGSRFAGYNAMTNYVWPLPFGYGEQPATATSGGVRLKYYPRKAGRWSKLAAACSFFAIPNEIVVGVYKNGVLTALKVDLTSAGMHVEVKGSNDSDEVFFDVGDEIDIQVENVTAIAAGNEVDYVTATVHEEIFP